MSNYGIYFYKPLGVFICIVCGTGIQPDRFHGHIVSTTHWGDLTSVRKPSKGHIATAAKHCEFIPHDQPIKLPEGRIRPFPFLKLLTGHYCKGTKSGKPCQFCCPSPSTMDKHISAHHAVERDSEGYRKSKDMYRSGDMQRWYLSGAGSSCFRVDPTLAGVDPGSDFDLWYASLLPADREGFLSAEAMVGDGDEGIELDVSPFMQKAGWNHQIQGYSWRSLAKKAMLPLRSEDIFLRKVPKLAKEYLDSMSQDDVTASVHPQHLQHLNNWKRCVTLGSC
jgi:hypothetical protein